MKKPKQPKTNTTSKNNSDREAAVFSPAVHNDGRIGQSTFEDDVPTILSVLRVMSHCEDIGATKIKVDDESRQYVGLIINGKSSGIRVYPIKEHFARAIRDITSSILVYLSDNVEKEPTVAQLLEKLRVAEEKAQAHSKENEHLWGQIRLVRDAIEERGLDTPDGASVCEAAEALIRDITIEDAYDDEDEFESEFTETAEAIVDEVIDTFFPVGYSDIEITAMKKAATAHVLDILIEDDIDRHEACVFDATEELREANSELRLELAAVTKVLTACLEHPHADELEPHVLAQYAGRAILTCRRALSDLRDEKSRLAEKLDEKDRDLNRAVLLLRTLYGCVLRGGMPKDGPGFDFDQVADFLGEFGFVFKKEDE